MAVLYCIVPVARLPAPRTDSDWSISQIPGYGIMYTLSTEYILSSTYLTMYAIVLCYFNHGADGVTNN